jgi:NitT/TauT family transport system substrate-binding protein
MGETLMLNRTIQHNTPTTTLHGSRHLRNAVAAAAIASASLLAVLPGSSWARDDAASNAIRVAIAPTTTALPVVVADKEGYFKEAGLDVTYKVSNVTISDQLVTVGRQFDIAMGTQPALITATQQGLQLVQITSGALDTKANPQAHFVVGPDSGIKSYADFAGKRLGTLSLTGNLHYAVLANALAAGVKLNDINWVVGTVPQMPDLLKAKRVAGIEEIQPFSRFAIANGGISISDPFRILGDKAFLGVFLADKAWANSHESQVLKFNKALQKAGVWIEKIKDEARTLVGTYTGARGKVLAETTIPDFEFQTTAKEVEAVMKPDLTTWIALLNKVTDQTVKVTASDMLPSWGGGK